MPAKRTAAHHSSDDTLLRNKARALSKTRPANTSAIQSRTWRSADTPEGALRVFCAGKTVQAARESMKQLKASVDAVAARHGLGLISGTGGLEGEQRTVTRESTPALAPDNQQSTVTRESKPALAPDNHHDDPNSREELKISDGSEDKGSETEIDVYSDGGMDEPETVVEDVYLVEKSCGCHHRDNFDEEMPATTPLKAFRQLKDANDFARVYLRSGKYARVPWETLEIGTTDELQVSVLAETKHHWYRIRVHKEQRQRVEPPFVYVVEEATRTYKVKAGKKEREESDVISRIAIFRDRRSANMFAGGYHKAFTEERVKEGYTQGETMVHGLLNLTHRKKGRKGEGRSIKVSVKRVPLL